MCRHGWPTMGRGSGRDSHGLCPASRELGRQAAGVYAPDRTCPETSLWQPKGPALQLYPSPFIPPHLCTPATRSLFLPTFELSG